MPMKTSFMYLSYLVSVPLKTGCKDSPAFLASGRLLRVTSRRVGLTANWCPAGWPEPVTLLDFGETSTRRGRAAGLDHNGLPYAFDRYYSSPLAMSYAAHYSGCRSHD